MASKSTPPLTAPAQPGDAKAPPARKPGQRADWQAIERDYRTGRFTQVELAAKHQVNAATLCRKIKADQAIDPTRWQQDLTDVVRQATKAALMADVIKEATENAQEGVNTTVNTVKAAAELNKQVILGHRRDIHTLSGLARTLMDRLNVDAPAVDALRTIADQAADTPEQRADLRKQLQAFLGTHTTVSSAQRLADTLLKLQNLERKAFGLGDGEDPQTPATPPPDGSVDPAEAYRWLCQQRT